MSLPPTQKPLPRQTTMLPRPRPSGLATHPGNWRPGASVHIPGIHRIPGGMNRRDQCPPPVTRPSGRRCAIPRGAASATALGAASPRAGDAVSPTGEGVASRTGKHVAARIGKGAASRITKGAVVQVDGVAAELDGGGRKQNAGSYMEHSNSHRVAS